MTEDEIFRIHVSFGDWRLPLDIARKDEEIYRKAERMLSALHAKYRHKYEHKTNEELMLIAAFHLAVALKKRDFVESTLPLAERIESLGKELEALLEKPEKD